MMCRAPRSERDRHKTPLFRRDWSVAEYILALLVFNRGMAVGFFDGNTVSAWDHLRFMPDAAFGALHMIIAALWAFGVYANGTMHRSPLLRMIGSGAGAFIMGLLTLNFIEIGSVNGSFVYATLFACQLGAFGKAAVDWGARQFRG